MVKPYRKVERLKRRYCGYDVAHLLFQLGSRVDHFGNREEALEHVVDSVPTAVAQCSLMIFGASQAMVTPCIDPGAALASTLQVSSQRIGSNLAVV
eukprot:scaffold9348_cov82-Cyclotella_meneghiniana.AAC.5